MGRPAINGLTPRQKELMLLIGQGLSGPEIAERMCVSTEYVQVMRMRIRRKFNIPAGASGSNSALTRLAISLNLKEHLDRFSKKYEAEIAKLNEQLEKKPERADLFQFGELTLSSGGKSGMKIECDSLSDEEIAGLAGELATRLRPFSEVEGVPTGGERLAEAMRAHANPEQGGRLVVDDVWTTGRSMKEHVEHSSKLFDQAAVLFARGPLTRVEGVAGRPVALIHVF